MIVSIFNWIKYFFCTKMQGQVVEPMYFSCHNMQSASYMTFEAVQSVQEVLMGQFRNVQVGFLLVIDTQTHTHTQTHIHIHTHTHLHLHHCLIRVDHVVYFYTEAKPDRTAKLDTPLDLKRPAETILTDPEPMDESDIHQCALIRSPHHS